MIPVIRISKGQPCPTSLVPYSGKFFNMHKFQCADTSEEFFMLLFSCNAHTTLLPVDVHTPHENLATRKNNEAKKQGYLFVLTYARHMTSSISTLVCLLLKKQVGPRKPQKFAPIEKLPLHGMYGERYYVCIQYV